MTSRITRRRRRIPVAAATACFLVLAVPAAASAADLGGDCCADLEERIAELEQSTVRKPNRNIELTIKGTLSLGLLGWNDGVRSDAYVVTNDNDGVNLTFEGEASEINDGPWSVGFVMEIDLNRNLSSEVSQSNDNGLNPADPSVPPQLEVGDEAVWVEHKDYGRVTLGQTKGGSDATQEADLSDTEALSYVGVSDIGGGFQLRTGKGPNDLVDLTWGDVLDEFSGLSGALVRYETPELSGFTLSGAWGMDDAWDVGGAYSGGFGDFKMDAGLGYAEDLQGNHADVASTRTVTGSVSVLHEPSGISVTVAGGHRQSITAVELSDGSLGTPGDASFGYGKLGWQHDFTELGKTAFYGEYGMFRGITGKNASAEAVAGIAGIVADDVCSAPGVACFATDSDARIWGFGVVQHIEELDAQFYLGYRRQDLDLSLTDSTGAKVPSNALKGIDLVMAGMKLEF